MDSPYLLLQGDFAFFLCNFLNGELEADPLMQRRDSRR